MKFEIESSEFKSLVERATAVCNKKGTQFFRSIYISADMIENRVSFSATNGTSSVTIVSKGVSVEEGGYATADINDIAKFCSINGIINFSSGVDYIKAVGEKKRGEIKNSNLDMPKQPKSIDEAFVIVNKNVFLESLSTLSCCLSSDNTRSLYTGYNVDTAKNRISSCDGYRYAYRRMETVWSAEEKCNVTIPGNTYHELKKISGKSDDENFVITKNEKWFKVSGADFTYYSRFLNGEYIDLDAHGEYNYDYEITLKKSDIENAAKEYSKLSKDSRKPMYFLSDGKEFRTAFISESYRTSDIIDIREIGQMPEKMMAAYSPLYVKEAAVIFEDDYINVKCGNAKCPIEIDNGDYKAVVLPIFSKDTYNDTIKNLIYSI